MNIPLFSLSILYFLFILFSLGYVFLHIFPVQMREDFFIRSIVYVGSGLGVLICLIVAFDVVGISIKWWTIGLVALVSFVYYYIQHVKKHGYTPANMEHATWSYLIVLIAVLLLSVMFLQGAYNYPYLEDDDPWGHAVGVLWVEETGSYYQETAGGVSHYLEPYPPTYDAILSLMYGINGTVFHTLKVFNVILLALGLLFFFVFARELFGHWVGIVSVIFLVALPSSASHFIWSHTLALVLFPLAMFAAVRAFEHKRWIVPAIILVAAMMVIHPFVSVLFGVFYVVFVLWQLLFGLDAILKEVVISTHHPSATPPPSTRFWQVKKVLQKFVFSDHAFSVRSWNPFTRSFLVGFFGLLLSFVYWGQQLLRHGLLDVLYSHTGGFGGVSQAGAAQTVVEQYINPAYGLFDFLIAGIYTPIDQPTGFGVVAFLLVLCGVLFILVRWRKYLVREKFHIPILTWFVLSFIGLLGGHLPFSILTHRFWAYVTIPFVLVVSVFVVWLVKGLWSWKKIACVVVCLFFFVGVFGVPFSMQLSLDVNPDYDASLLVKDVVSHPIRGGVTAINILSSWQPKKISAAVLQWPPGVAWEGVEEIEGYIWMYDTIEGARVLSLCQEEKLLLGFDLKTHFADDVVDLFRKTLSEKSVNDIVSFGSLYDFVSLEHSCVSKGYLSQEGLDVLANELAAVFDVVYVNEAMVVYQVS